MFILLRVFKFVYVYRFGTPRFALQPYLRSSAHPDPWIYPARTPYDVHRRVGLGCRPARDCDVIMSSGGVVQRYTYPYHTASTDRSAACYLAVKGWDKLLHFTVCSNSPRSSVAGDMTFPHMCILCKSSIQILNLKIFSESRDFVLVAKS